MQPGVSHGVPHLGDGLDALVLGEEVGTLRLLDAAEQQHVEGHEAEHGGEPREHTDAEQPVEHGHRDGDLEPGGPQQVLEVGKERRDRLDVDRDEVHREAHRGGGARLVRTRARVKARLRVRARIG